MSIRPKTRGGKKSAVALGGDRGTIAAQALSMKLTLVTNNSRHFKRVASLTTENWL